MAKRRIAQTTPHDSSGSLVFRYRRSRQNSNIPNWGAKCRWGRLNLETFDKTRYKSKTSTGASVVNLVQSQVYHTERPLFAARLLWCSASHGFVSDSWYLFYFWFTSSHIPWAQSKNTLSCNFCQNWVIDCIMFSTSNSTWEKFHVSIFALFTPTLRV